MVDKMFWTCLMNSHKLNGIILHLMFTTEMKLLQMKGILSKQFHFKTFHVSRFVTWQDQIKSARVCREDDVISANPSFNLGKVTSAQNYTEFWPGLLSFDCYDSDWAASLITEEWGVSQTEAWAEAAGGSHIGFYCDQLRPRHQSHHRHEGSL